MDIEALKLSNLYLRIAQDSRVNVWHVALYVCLLMLWEKSGFQEQIKISRKQLMNYLHFGSITTYHKSIKRLTELEYIKYLPTYDSHRGTVIKINQPCRTET